MKYFLHDTSAFDDEKVTRLFMNFGYEGLGLFYTILEKLGKQEKPVKTEVLKKQLRVGKKLEKCWNFMESIDIISSNNGETFNKQLLNFSEKYAIKKEKTREKVLQWRNNQKDIENVTSYVPNCNPPKVKESKVNKSKENIEGEKPPSPLPHSEKIDFVSIIKSYHDFCPNLTAVREISEKRKTAIRSRIKEFGIEKVNEVFKIAGQSVFLSGVNDRGFKADIDFVLKPDKFISILEGKYSNNKNINYVRTSKIERGDPKIAIEQGYMPL